MIEDIGRWYVYLCAAIGGMITLCGGLLLMCLLMDYTYGLLYKRLLAAGLIHNMIKDAKSYRTQSKKESTDE